MESVCLICQIEAFHFLWHRMGETNTKEIWKRLFNVLFNNKVPDDELPNMWSQFKEDNLHTSEIRIAFESLKEYLHEDVRTKLCGISSEGGADEVSLLAALRDCSQLDDNFWRLLFTAIRDREVEQVGEEKRILIL